MQIFEGKGEAEINLQAKTRHHSGRWSNFGLVNWVSETNSSTSLHAEVLSESISDGWTKNSLQGAIDCSFCAEMLKILQNEQNYSKSQHVSFTAGDAIAIRAESQLRIIAETDDQSSCATPEIRNKFQIL